MTLRMNWLQRMSNRLCYIAPGGYSFRPWLHRQRGVHIGREVWISQLVYIDEIHPSAVSIGDRCTIGLRTSIVAHLYWGPRQEGNCREVVLEDDVYVGPHCVILPGVRIGCGSVIKAGAVVDRRVPPHAFWDGARSCPVGRVTVPLSPGHTYKEFTMGLRPWRQAPPPMHHNGTDEEIAAHSAHETGAGI